MDDDMVREGALCIMHLPRYRVLSFSSLSMKYRVRRQNSLLEIEERAALGSTSQCSPVLPSNPFPVGHSAAELGIK